MPTSMLFQDAWGKLQRADSDHPMAWHPLVDHLHDVAACFDALMRCENIRRAAEASAGRALSEQDLSRLGVLVFFHDLGKANAGFQAKRFVVSEGPRDWTRLHCSHSQEALMDGAWTLYERHLPFSSMLDWGTATQRLLLASISHHGRPVNEPTGADYKIWKDILGADGSVLYSPAATLQAIGDAALRRYPLAFQSLGEPLPETAAFGHWFAGIAQMADWLGSDTRFFEYSAPGEPRGVTSINCAKNAISALGLDADVWRAPLTQSRMTFTDAVDITKPWPFQEALGDLALDRLVILESETGSGKTEAVLWRYLQLFQAGAVDSLYFALPTRAAASQLYQRLLRFVERVWPENAPMVVRALAGYAAVDNNEIKARLPDFEVLWADNPADLVAHRRWSAESPKRFLAAPIAVGTIDQALLATLQVRHAHLRHMLLSRSLLVIDEVHASDAYMGALIEHLLRSHLATGSHALLLSATLGSVARTRYQATLQPRSTQLLSLPPLAETCTLPYPAVSDGTKAPQPVIGSSQKKVVHWHSWPAIDDPTSIAERAIQAAIEGARVLVIRNTVPNAVAIFHAVESAAQIRGLAAPLLTVNGIATLHHSRFSKQCRPLLDRAVETQLGKHRSSLEGRIVIGTQTLEQSLDLDADLLITDLCPMDVLLQRVGRLHRHTRPAEERSAGYRHAQAIVLTPAAEDWPGYLKRSRNGLGRFNNGGGVYTDLRILEATWRLVDAQATRHIPQDNRVLVEEATHPEALAAIADAGGEEWQVHQEAIEGSKGGERSLGNLHALAFNKHFDEAPFAGSDEIIATRLGVADRLVEFDPPQSGPFGEAVRQMTLRHHMLPKQLPLDAIPLITAADQSGFSFALAEAHYRYSRLGIERLRSE